MIANLGLGMLKKSELPGLQSSPSKILSHQSARSSVINNHNRSDLSQLANKSQEKIIQTHRANELHKNSILQYDVDLREKLVEIYNNTNEDFEQELIEKPTYTDFKRNTDFYFKISKGSVTGCIEVPRDPPKKIKHFKNNPNVFESKYGLKNTVSSTPLVDTDGYGPKTPNGDSMVFVVDMEK